MMDNQRKIGLHGTAKAANSKQIERHFTESAKRVKLEFIRLAAWLSIAKGV
jgi:hypothetical protein